MRTEIAEKTKLKDLPIEKDYPVSIYLKCSNFTLKPAKNGSQFLQFNGLDETGSVVVKRWKTNEEYLGNIKKCKVALINGRVDDFKGELSIVAEDITPVEKELEEKLLSSLLPKSSYDVGFLKKELWRYIQSVENKHIKELLELTLKEPEIKEKIAVSAAAISHHHPYKSGLLTHIVRLMYLMDGVISAFNNFPFPNSKYKINRDLVLTGVMWHDLYKISEYSDLDYNPEGYLINHLARGAIEINRLMDKITNFPSEIRLQISHLLLSHHGRLEYGSPVTPCTVESVILHHIDNLAAKVDPMIEALDKLPPGEVWTERLKSIEKQAYLGGMLIKNEQ